uniref:Uncharacterized protein n=1 Tax=mine drainage metagenome TaxID=410659 RepID=E6PVD3_9ZZZZ
MAVSCSGARTAAIGVSRGEAFYRGEIAEALARHSAAYGGAMSRDALGDLITEPRPRLFVAARTQCGRTGQASVPHHHPRFCDEGGSGRDGLRGHGPGGHPKCSTYGHPNCSTLAAVI